MDWVVKRFFNRSFCHMARKEVHGEHFPLMLLAKAVCKTQILPGTTGAKAADFEDMRCGISLRLTTWPASHLSCIGIHEL